MIFASNRTGKYSHRTEETPGEHSPGSLGVWIVAVGKRDV